MQHGHAQSRSTSSRSDRIANEGARGTPRRRLPVPGLVLGSAVLAVLAAALPSADRSTATPEPSVAADATGLAQASASDVAARADAFCAAPPPAAAPIGTELGVALLPLRDALYRAELGPGSDGAGYRVECLDPETVITYRFTLEDVERRTTLAGHTLITAFEDRHEVEAPRDRRLTAGSVVAETISLPPTIDWRPAADGDGIVAFLEARRAGASTRTCARTLTGRCSTALDIGWRVRAANPGALVVEQSIWVNGVAATRAVWRLEI